MDTIRLGRADVVMVGGAEAASTPLTIGSFAQMQAMSRRNDEPERASRPWDVDRDGLVMGEGSVLFVVEPSSMPRRGARILGEARRGRDHGRRHDMVQPEPSGAPQARPRPSPCAPPSSTPVTSCT